MPKLYIGTPATIRSAAISSSISASLSASVFFIQGSRWSDFVKAALIHFSVTGGGGDWPTSRLTSKSFGRGCSQRRGNPAGSRRVFDPPRPRSRALETAPEYIL